jgi:hypothetical protein
MRKPELVSKFGFAEDPWPRVRVLRSDDLYNDHSP